MFLLLIGWGVMRISDGSSYFEYAEEVANELKVRGNEVNAIDRLLWLYL